MNEPLDKTRTMPRRARMAAASTTAIALPLMAPVDARVEPIPAARPLPSFDISAAWERAFWAMRGRLNELGIGYEVQQLAVQDATDHEGRLGQVDSVIQRGVDAVMLGATQ